MPAQRDVPRPESMRHERVGSELTTQRKSRPRECPTQPVSPFAPLEVLATYTTSRLGVHSI